eukprot:288651_1
MFDMAILCRPRFEVVKTARKVDHSLDHSVDTDSYKDRRCSPVNNNRISSQSSRKRRRSSTVVPRPPRRSPIKSGLPEPAPRAPSVRSTKTSQRAARTASDSSEIIVRRKVTKRVSSSGNNGTRSTLDKCLADQTGWSTARVRAYSLIDSNPNAYFYRFNAPGEPHHTGRWTEEEEELLLEKLKTHKIDGRWGLLARHIPGRVGYQCSSQVRKMVNDGRISRSFLATLKKVRNDFGVMGNQNEKAKRPDKVEIAPKNAQKSHSKTVEKLKIAEIVSNSPSLTEQSGDEFTPAPYVHVSLPKGLSEEKQKLIRSRILDIQRRYSKTYTNEKASPPCKNKRTSAKPKPQNPITEPDSSSGDDSDSITDPHNPLPGFIDAITLGPIRDPTISQQGYVLGYDIWVKSLRLNSNRCPFTYSQVTRRSLIRLTKDNIEDYRARIMNWQKK